MTELYKVKEAFLHWLSTKQYTHAWLRMCTVVH